MKETRIRETMGRWLQGRLGFSAKTERTVFFVLTLLMLVYGAVIRLMGG